jgi:hypothetical protein
MTKATRIAVAFGLPVLPATALARAVIDGLMQLSR